MTIDKQFFDRVRDYLSKASPPPWIDRVQESCRDWHEILSAESPGMDIARVAPWSGAVEANAHFIAQVRTDLPLLLDHIEDQEKKIQELTTLVEEAVEDIKSWAAYADKYFQEKHDLVGTLERYQKALTILALGS